MTNSLSGIFAASITPLDEDGLPAPHVLPGHLRYLESSGCHGALILGTTGEAPSLSVEERTSIMEVAAAERGTLKLLAGTGAASLTDAIQLTRAAFELDFDGVLVVPPFYFKGASEEGLFAFYSKLIAQAVPADRHLYLYHIPQISAVPIEPDLIRRLRSEFPGQIAGVKDSSGSIENTRMLCREFDAFQVFTGHDALLTASLDAGAAGAITALANIAAAQLREIFDDHQAGKTAPEGAAQQWLHTTRDELGNLGLSLPVVMKTVLHIKGVTPNDNVRPPLQPLSDEDVSKIRDYFGL